MMDENIYKRLARVEAMTNSAKAELAETLSAAYSAACEAENADDAAMFARKIRNKLLEASDAQMTLDRIGLDVSSVAGFIASLSKIFRGEWSKYRQALRDLPEQEGFPFNVEFPKPPDGDDSSGGS